MSLASQHLQVFYMKSNYGNGQNEKFLISFSLLLSVFCRVFFRWKFGTSANSDLSGVTFRKIKISMPLNHWSNAVGKRENRSKSDRNKKRELSSFFQIYFSLYVDVEIHVVIVLYMAEIASDDMKTNEVKHKQQTDNLQFKEESRI